MNELNKPDKNRYAYLRQLPIGKELLDIAPVPASCPEDEAYVDALEEAIIEREKENPTGFFPMQISNGSSSRPAMCLRRIRRRLNLSLQNTRLPRRPAGTSPKSVSLPQRCRKKTRIPSGAVFDWQENHGGVPGNSIDGCQLIFTNVYDNAIIGDIGSTKDHAFTVKVWMSQVL